ncbi:fibronectin type III [Pelagophyceae sp. CCMP2097]|nr:fibronectin type III [Pelagophyceae sp. CCMP2097]
MLAESGQPSAACRICLALLRPDCVSAHEAKCREKARTSNDAKNASSSPTGVGNVAFPPQPPRHFAVSSVGPMSISLEWAPPILDGGSTVVEYEVSLSYVKILGKVGKQIQLEIVHLPPVLTTAFADRHPVSDFGHVLTGLEGGVEYRGLSVRCQNAVGWSPASDVVESVWTAAAVPPSAPQCLRHLPPTRTTVALHWAPPFYDGGAVVCDYVVSYTELRRLTPNEWVSEKNAFSRQQLAAGERLVNGKHELRTAVTLNVGGPATRKVLRGLRGGTDYEHVAIAALSVKRLLSPFCRLGGVITTLPPSARALLETELARAAAVRGDFLDTDFYQGFLQREAKADYVSRLESDLQQTIEAELRESLATPPADGVEQEEADELLEEAAVLSAAESVKASAYVPTADEDDEAEACALVPGYLLQRGQFEHRLEALRVGILDAEKVQTASFVERAALTKSMADCQLRLLAIQAEVDRVSGLRAQYINSSVMHGSVQRFTKPQLQKDLQLELEKCFGKIADAKRQARALDETRTGAVKAAKRKLDELQERRAALQGIKAAAKRQAALQKVAQKSSAGVERSYERDAETFGDPIRASVRAHTGILDRVLNRTLGWGP